LTPLQAGDTLRQNNKTLMDLYYKHSGRFTPFGVLAGFVAGLACSIPLAALYTYGIIEIPYIKLRALSTLCFGLAAGGCTGVGLVWGKVRSSRISGLVGLLVSALALYASWVAWLVQIFSIGRINLKSFDLLFHPMVVWQIIGKIKDIGTWGSFGTESTHGNELTVIWVIEALTVLAIGTVTAAAVVRRKPFCENCDAWCNRSEKLIFFPSVFGPELKRRLEAKELSFVEKLVPTSEKFAHIRFELFSCASCNMLNTISVSQLLVQPATSRWSKAKAERKEILNLLLVTPEEAALIRRVAIGVSGTPAAASSAAAAAK
jgi:hypothetical protein